MTDIKTYIDGYQGPSRLMRLEFIAELKPEYKCQAIKMALEYLKNQSLDTQRYLQLCNIFESEFPKEAVEECGVQVIDREWASTTSAKADMEMKTLEVAAREANGSQKEVAIAMENLAQFYVSRGMYKRACAEYTSLEKYISTQHFASNSVEIMKLLLVNNQHGRLIDRAHKTATRGKDSKEALTIAGTVRAIAEMKFTRYGPSADSLLKTPYCLCDSLYHILKPEDIAIYGTLCSLASFDRQKIKGIMENPDFKKFLEHEPTCVTILQYYLKTKYKECFELLEKRKADFLLDMHLNKHVDQLYRQISDRAIVLYAQPYTAVSMVTMSTHLGIQMETLRERLEHLIESNRLDARINSHEMILTRKDRDERSHAFDHVLQQASSFEKRIEGALLHINLMKINTVIQDKAGKKSAQNDKFVDMDFDEVMVV